MEKNCLYCGSHFTTNRSNKKYCNTNCKQMAYFTRNGMVLAGMSGSTMKVVQSELKMSNVKDEIHSEKPETVKYVSATPNVKYETDSPNVKSVSSSVQNEKAIDELFDRLIASIENRFNKALEKAKQELNEKYESVIQISLQQREPGLCNEEKFEGTTKFTRHDIPKVKYCNPCSTLSVKYDSEKSETQNTPSSKKDFTIQNPVKNETQAIVFPQIQSAGAGISKNIEPIKSPEKNKSAPQLRSLPLLDENEEASEEHLAELEHNEALAGSHENEDKEEEDDYEDFYEEENTEPEEDDQSADKIRIAELKRQLEEFKSKKEKPAVAPIKEEPEQEYKYIQSRIVKKIEMEYEKINRQYLHHDIYKGFNIEQKIGASWLNTRLCCLLESMIKLSNYAEIDNHTLRCMTDAFSRLIKSKAYQIVSEEVYQFKGLIYELYIKLYKNLNRNLNDPFISFKLPFDLKARLIAIRRELKKVSEPIKFTEIDFNEVIGLPEVSRSDKKKNDASGWQLRYRAMKKEKLNQAA